MNANQLQLLSGLKIIDTTVNLPGPVAGAILARLGAEVIKLEPPAGDPVAISAPLYRTINGQKECRTYDLSSSADREECKELIREADGILVGMRAPALKKLGLDYDALRKINPKLIYCHVTGYPADSGKAQAPGHDLTYLAETGLLQQLFPDPCQVTTQLADMTGALYGVIAFLAALHYRQATGKGLPIEINLQESPALLGLIPQHDPLLARRLQGEAICYRVYQTADGWVALGALEPKFFASFVSAIGHPEWQGEGLRLAEPGDEVFEAIREAFRQHPTVYWMEVGKRHDIPLEAVQPFAQKEGFSLPFRL